MIKITNQTDFTTKYIIETSFKIRGVVEKSDIVGAIFGQTEGLLLDLDLRDLQKSGRIGRIEVENESKEGVSEGIIKVPSSLTRKETALLAATIETVSRVGPCEAEINLIEIRDVRDTKRKKIIERAAELLKEWDQKQFNSNQFYIEDTDIRPSKIIKTKRLGIPPGRGDHLLYRFIDFDNVKHCTKNPLTVRKSQLGIDYLIKKPSRFSKP